MLKKYLCCLLCFLLAAMSFAAMAETEFTMAGFEGEGSTHDWTTNLFFVRMQERTGISFTFQQYDKEDEWQKAKDAMFADGGELPDVLFKAALTSDEMMRYTESGQLIDLKPLLEENAPNLWAVLQQNPDWLASVTLPSGKIGALPSIQEPAPQDAIWINEAWLKKLGLDMPTDFASLREVLTAFRERDPNGNSKKDEIGLSFLGPWELKFFSHAWGAVANDYNIYLDEAGKVQYWPAEDSFIELAETVSALFRDGLLDPNGFITADTLRRITDEEAINTYGAFFAPTPLNVVTYGMCADYVVLEPFAYEGKQIYRDLFSPLTRGAFAITSACEDPAALLRWVDILYTEEGAIEAMVGVEGDQYIIHEDGAWDWKGGLESLSLETLNELSIYDTGDMPWLFPTDFYNRYADETVRRINTEMDKLIAFVKQPFPTSYTLTTEERAHVAALQNELGPYVDEMLACFVMGELEINDDTISEFREGLTERGMEEMKAFWQGIADRMQ